MCLVIAGQPFDMIKVKLQTAKAVPGEAPEFTGALDAARKIIAREGVRLQRIATFGRRCM
jgi:hypothetical protein